jgi:cytochrome c peroxidase
MMKRKIYIVVLFTLSFLILAFVSSQDPYFLISKKDVELNIPKGFPKPNYIFKNNKITPEGFVLGRKLFYDPILSKDSSISCGSCHQQFAAFSHIDHALAHGIGGRIGKRNVPALQNLIWNKAFMWDGGINHIEVQAISPITNKDEMDENLEQVIAKLNHSKDYRIAFYQAFKDSIITSEKMLKSLTQFMGLMISSNAKYDQYISGKESLSEEELKGLKLFRSKCANCHKEPLFTDNTYKSNGLPINKRLDDKGRHLITGNENDLYKFKVPSLRNVELSFPYMHDGRFKNLNEVLNFYSDSSKHAISSDVLIHNIGELSKEDLNALHTFLLTLTDKSFVYNRRFADPNFSRKSNKK